jgi:serine/threonine-protein kinase
MIGRVLAERYRIDSLVARGGMARVYRAHDDRLDRMVAVKVLAPPYSDDADFTERFLGEARAAASLSHPSLVHVYDSGSDDAAHFIVMELLDRHRTLRDVLDDRGTLPVGEVIRIGRELLAGLRVVHEHGLVHCDVKAANVMLGPGPAKLIDFGIAQPPHQGLEGEMSIGTLQSMSPEQLRGDALTPASDLFSLGVVLYQAITGRMPYTGTTPEAVSAAHAADSVEPPSAIVPDLPGRLDAVVLQSLRRDPAGRFHSAVAMGRALEVVAADAGGSDDETRVVRTAAAPAIARGTVAGYVPPPVPDRPPAPRPAAPRPRRERSTSRPERRRGPWGALGMLAMLAAAALVVFLVVLPLLGLGDDGGGSGDLPSAEPTTPVASPTVAPNVIPATVGLPTAEAIALASEAGFNWTVRCNHDESQPEGIIDQEPAAGTEVPPGSRFTMFSARIDDCQGGGDGGDGERGNSGNNGRGNDD